MEGSEENIDQELQKELLVVKTDTVVHPRTVVVHARHTSAADAAVVAHWRLHTVALLTLLVEHIVQEMNMLGVQRSFGGLVVWFSDVYEFGEEQLHLPPLLFFLVPLPLFLECLNIFLNCCFHFLK